MQIGKLYFVHVSVSCSERVPFYPARKPARSQVAPPGNEGTGEGSRELLWTTGAYHRRHVDGHHVWRGHYWCNFHYVAITRKLLCHQHDDLHGFRRPRQGIPPCTHFVGVQYLCLRRVAGTSLGYSCRCPKQRPMCCGHLNFLYRFSAAAWWNLSLAVKIHETLTVMNLLFVLFFFFFRWLFVLLQYIDYACVFHISGE